VNSTWKKHPIKHLLFLEIGKIIDETMQMPPESGITPDSWVILEVNHEGKQFQKILSGWSGGYLDGNSWRLSSPIREINIDINKDYITVDTNSGSQYTLYKSYQSLRMSNAGIYNQLKERFGDAVEIVEL
jgi:V8-like Glu-specific endopeptidase